MSGVGKNSVLSKVLSSCTALSEPRNLSSNPSCAEVGLKGSSLSLADGTSKPELSGFLVRKRRLMLHTLSELAAHARSSDLPRVGIL